MNSNKTGAELIADERNEQLTKHNRTVENDYLNNDENQLAIGAMRLIEGGIMNVCDPPKQWDGDDIWPKMVNKSYKERLIIAGALIAAEIDRLDYVDIEEPNTPNITQP